MVNSESGMVQISAIYSFGIKTTFQRSLDEYSLLYKYVQTIQCRQNVKFKRL